MTIFTPEDERRIRTVHEKRAAEDKELFFDYFGDKAVNEITEMITLNKETYLQEFEKHARTYSTRNLRSIPILTFNTVQQLQPQGKVTRKNVRAYYAQSEPPGSYYSSLSGIHVVDLHSIYSNSLFRQKMNERLGGTFSISMRSKVIHNFVDVCLYENVLYLNAHI